MRKFNLIVNKLLFRNLFAVHVVTLKPYEARK